MKSYLYTGVLLGLLVPAMQANAYAINDPEHKFTVAVYAVMSFESYALNARNVCEELAPSHAKSNMIAYEEWRKEHSSIFADLPIALEKSINIVALHEKVDRAVITETIKKFQAEGRAGMLARFKSAPAKVVQQQCAAFPQLLETLSPTQDKQIVRDVEAMRRLGLEIAKKTTTK